MAEIKLNKRYKYAGDIFQNLIGIGFDVETATDFLNEVEDADVEEVVRCKDCKHFTKEMIAGDLEFICKSAEGMINPAPNKYCSYGTPKERGEEK